MGKVMHLTFSSSLSQITEKNESFDAGVLRVAYAGNNRNGSYISKKTFEKAMPSIFNCPVVCNYNRETDSIGGHDMEVYTDSDGELNLVNLTQPVGVVPESASYRWETVVEDDGSEHEYLDIDVVLWKRQEAYKKIKEDGIVAHSMEINVNDGEMSDGRYVINDMTFTAFCLLGDGVEPCFESAGLEVFSYSDFKSEWQQMMNEYKQYSLEPNGIDINDKVQKGGREVLEEKLALLEKFGIDRNSLDFDIEEMTIEELIQKFDGDPEPSEESGGEESGGEESGEPGAGATEPGADNTEGGNTEGGNTEGGNTEGGNTEEGEDGDGESEEVDDNEEDDACGKPKKAADYSLQGTFMEELREQLHSVTIEMPWGEDWRYCYVDHDPEIGQVYAYDEVDWKLYGFEYSLDGDSVVINFESKKRKKFVIEDFIEGSNEVDSGIAGVFSKAKEFIDSQNEELNSMKELKNSAEQREYELRKENIFDEFKDLNGVEEFDTLRDTMGISIEDLREKCFALRGKHMTQFSKNTNHNRIAILEPQENSEEPYGGLFKQYGF